MKVYGHDTPNNRLGNKTLFTDLLNNSSKRYFSGTDAEIYFEETYIDEVVEIQYTLQQNTMPLFGYNSYVYDDIATGSRLVSGQFAINFTKAGYLIEVLDTLKGIKTPGKIKVTTNSEGTVEEQDSLQSTKNTDAFWDNQHRPVWDKRFDIWISYGDYKTTPQGPLSTFQIITGVQITGVTQQLSIEGNPIMEIYSFIAQDIITAPRPTTMPEIETTPAPKEVITFDNLYYDEKITKKYYPQSLAMWNEKDVATGFINIEYESAFEIESIQIEPMLYLGNPSAPAGALDVQVGSPIKYEVGEELRRDIKSYSSKIDSIDYFDLNMIVSYKDANGNSLKETITKQVTIKHIIKDL